MKTTRKSPRKSLGQVAYETHWIIPCKWSDQPSFIRKDWHRVAAAVVRAHGKKCTPKPSKMEALMERIMKERAPLMKRLAASD